MACPLETIHETWRDIKTASLKKNFSSLFGSFLSSRPDSLESWNHLGWKKPHSRSLSPPISPALPNPPSKHIPKCHIHVSPGPACPMWWHSRWAAPSSSWHWCVSSWCCPAMKQRMRKEKSLLVTLITQFSFRISLCQLGSEIFFSWDFGL